LRAKETFKPTSLFSVGYPTMRITRTWRSSATP